MSMKEYVNELENALSKNDYESAQNILKEMEINFPA
jgi:uncharacterized membrane protein